MSACFSAAFASILSEGMPSSTKPSTSIESFLERRSISSVIEDLFAANTSGCTIDKDEATSVLVIIAGSITFTRVTLALKISGGEKQRVAIARALINDPHIIMCDEPTGNLDVKNSEIVFDIFKQLTSEFNQTLLVVTHDNSFAERTDRIIEMEDGKIIRQ